jgi:hypothetical protein
MKFVLKLAPGFLRRFDEYLRLNHPWFWATRLHLNLYLAIFSTAISVAIGFIIPTDMGDTPHFMYLGNILRILAIPAIAWLILEFRQLSLYNADKSHGKQSAYREFFVLIVYLITFALPLTFPVPATMILEHRIQNLGLTEEFALDYFSINSYFWTIMIILVFYIAILFNIFKQVRAKNFFLNFAFCGGILFLLGIFSALFLTGNIIIHGILYLTIVLIIFCIIEYIKGRVNLIVYQAFILLNVLLPLLGVILLSYLDVVSDSFPSPTPDTIRIALYSGFIVHVLLWNSLFKMAYLQLWNLPKAS